MSGYRKRRFLLGGIRIDALERTDLIEVLENARIYEEKILVFHHNLHSLYLHGIDPAVRDAYARTSWVYIDGMPVIWMARFAGLPFEVSHRITFLDSFDVILSEAARRNWRIFYLGSTIEVVNAAMMKFKEQYPKLEICGRHGFFDQEGAENQEVIAQINNFNADVLFVGMGMPVQEKWIAKNSMKLEVSGIVTSGATLDYVTGQAYRPPKWAGPLGLYGVFRMFSDPRRLWRRYLLEPIWVVKCLALPLIRQRWAALGEQSGAQ